MSSMMLLPSWTPLSKSWTTRRLHAAKGRPGWMETEFSRKITLLALPPLICQIIFPSTSTSLLPFYCTLTHLLPFTFTCLLLFTATCLFHFTFTHLPSVLLHLSLPLYLHPSPSLCLHLSPPLILTSLPHFTPVSSPLIHQFPPPHKKTSLVLPHHLYLHLSPPALPCMTSLPALPPPVSSPLPHMTGLPSLPPPVSSPLPPPVSSPLPFRTGLPSLPPPVSPLYLPLFPPFISTSLPLFWTYQGDLYGQMQGDKM